jgi:hypothetical protein
MEYQNTSVGTNIGLTAQADIEGLKVTYAQIDIEDAAGVTQNGTIMNGEDSLLEDVSDAVAGKVVRGIIISASNVTGKLIEKNDKTTLVAALNEGIMTYSYSKTEDTDGVFGATAVYEF